MINNRKKNRGLYFSNFFLHNRVDLYVANNKYFLHIAFTLLNMIYNAHGKYGLDRVYYILFYTVSFYSFESLNLIIDVNHLHINTILLFLSFSKSPSRLQTLSSSLSLFIFIFLTTESIIFHWYSLGVLESEAVSISSVHGGKIYFLIILLFSSNKF